MTIQWRAGVRQPPGGAEEHDVANAGAFHAEVEGTGRSARAGPRSVAGGDHARESP